LGRVGGCSQEGDMMNNDDDSPQINNKQKSTINRQWYAILSPLCPWWYWLGP
jgi:hypothetical protein